MSTYNTSSKVGKSLLKYFRPIRTGSLGQFNQIPIQRLTSENQSQEQSKKKQPEQKLATVHKIEEAKKAAVPKPGHHGNWLDVVVYLMDVCHTTSGNGDQASGTKNYKHMIDGAMKQKIKTVGSIVDTDTETAADVIYMRKVLLKKEEDIQKFLQEQREQKQTIKEETPKAEPKAANSAKKAA